MVNSALLNPKELRLRSQCGVLWLERGETRIELAPPKRALPLSSPDEWIVLISTDGNELGTLRRVDELDSKSRDALRASLEKEYHITTIVRVLDVERDAMSGQIEWHVQIESNDLPEDDSTSGREVTFRLSGGEDVQTARYPHIYFLDLEGNRFQIPDCEAMDLASRRASERYF